jgi:hypothetical protein
MGRSFLKVVAKVIGRNLLHDAHDSVLPSVELTKYSSLGTTSDENIWRDNIVAPKSGRLRFSVTQHSWNDI